MSQSVRKVRSGHGRCDGAQRTVSDQNEFVALEWPGLGSTDAYDLAKGRWATPHVRLVNTRHPHGEILDLHHHSNARENVHVHHQLALEAQEPARHVVTTLLLDANGRALAALSM